MHIKSHEDACNINIDEDMEVESDVLMKIMITEMWTLIIHVRIRRKSIENETSSFRESIGSTLI